MARAIFFLLYVAALVAFGSAIAGEAFAILSARG